MTITDRDRDKATFRIQVDSAGSRVDVEVWGRFDCDGWTVLEDALRPLIGYQPLTIVLDMAGVTAIEPAVALGMARTGRAPIRLYCVDSIPTVQAVLRANGGTVMLDTSPN